MPPFFLSLKCKNGTTVSGVQGTAAGRRLRLDFFRFGLAGIAAGLGGGGCGLGHKALLAEPGVSGDVPSGPDQGFLLPGAGRRLREKCFSEALF